MAEKAEGIQSQKGWREFTGGFTVGAFGGAAYCIFLTKVSKYAQRLKFHYKFYYSENEKAAS